MTFGKKLYFIIFLFVFITNKSIGQSISEYPIYLISTSFNNFLLSHEIRNTDSCKMNLSSYIRKNTGLFNDVYQTNTQLGTRINDASISLQFYSDVQGELISRNRIYTHYNTHIKLKKQLFGFAGLSAGIVNKSLGNANTSIQGSANVFDASAIVGLYNSKFIFLFSAFQIPQKAIMPINYAVPLLRYYQLYGMYTKEISEQFNNETVFIYNILEENQSEIIIGNQIIWNRFYKFGAEISNLNRINYFIDFAVKLNSKVFTSILVSYETSHNFNKKINSSISILNVGFEIKIK